LTEFFPDDFDIDLNGRTLPWEAAILIPFVEEDKFIDAESTLFENGMKLSPIEFEKNTTSFIYPSYTYDPSQAKGKDAKPLQSTLSSMKDLKNDFTTIEYHHDYEKCGTFGFTSALLDGVNLPCTNYPSLNWLGVVELDYTDKFVQKVAFK
jgi:5'-3' exonuclease